jgi:delta1-piperideine-2-carboxylate reductase
MSDPVISLSEVHAIATTILTGHGVSAEQARAVADTVTNAERDECKSHGLFRIPGYLKSVLSGKVDGQAIPEVNDLAPAVVHVDAKRGYAPLALEVGAVHLAEKARTQGIAALAITDCHHFAALWPETERLAEQGFVAFAFTGSNSFVAPAGGKQKLYGTNPMSFAWPRAGRSPVVFDQASSASARGEIQLHLRDGHTLPDGWAIDADGNPTNDPSAALAGAQLPFGGYKGAAIALMVELLAGALIGDVFSFEVSERDNGDGGPPTGGEFMIAIDPSRTRKDGGVATMAHAELLFERILGQDGTRLPSDRRFAARTRTAADGVSVAQVLYDDLQTLLAKAQA